MQNEYNVTGAKSVKNCPHCKLEIDKKASRCPYCHGKIYVWTTGRTIVALIFGVLFLKFFIGAVISVSTEPSSSSSPSTASVISSSESQTPPDPELLELVSYRCYDEYNYFHITGEVKNISDKPLAQVEIVGNAYTKSGELVKSQDALIEYDPILPDQISPFKVLMTGNPEIAKCDVNFKYLIII